MKKVCAIVLIAVALLIMMKPSTTGTEIITITVQSGDTIDGYYAKYAPSNMDKLTFRKKIMELNDITTCIYAGDSIKIITEEN